MKTKLTPGIAVAKSIIDGKGCFATRFFPARRKIAEYAGERISTREAVQRAARRAKHRMCAVDENWSIDGSRGGNGTNYINHSCEPNSFMMITHGHILFIALRDIHPGEEITIDYVQTYHSDEKRCRCGAPSCRATINKITT